MKRAMAVIGYLIGYALTLGAVIGLMPLFDRSQLEDQQFSKVKCGALSTVSFIVGALIIWGHPASY